MVSLSKNNKRTSLHQKYKVAKKVRQHHRDVKKSLKNTKAKKELPILMQIPMEVPFKDQIIKDINKASEMDKAAEKRRLAALRILKKQHPVNEFEQLKAKMIKDSSRAFIGDIRKLIEEADVILLVLDARDPMGTRSLEAEKLIKAANKTIIFVLNKIDLVPLDNMKAWAAHLSKEARTFPFKASCQEQAARLGKSSGAGKPSMDTSGSGAAFGVDNLVNYIKSLNKKSSTGGASSGPGKSADRLVVGVAGVPNTGKSSVINSLKRKRICEAGQLAGMTRSLQRVALDGHIELVDSPGIVLAAAKDAAEYALRNCVRPEKIEDPVTVAEAIIARCMPAQLQYLYKLPATPAGDATAFMLAFASRACPLKKRGVPDLRAASLRLIHDWNKGKIAYCAEAPVVTADGAEDDSLQLLSAADEVAAAKVTYRARDGVPSITVLGEAAVHNSMHIDEAHDSEDGGSVDMDE